MNLIHGGGKRRVFLYGQADQEPIATARKLAVLIYRMLRFGQDYVDVGEKAYEQQFAEKRLAGINAAAKSLGFKLVPKAPEPELSGATTA